MEYIKTDWDYERTGLFWNITLAVSIFLGIFIRVRGIGESLLSVDEFFLVKSVENILNHGVPQFDTGGFYSRGIGYQYLLALVYFITGVKVEISYRLVTIVFNLLAIPAIYQLGKKVAGQTVGYLTAILFCFSLWEIEFSRFIRFYAPFQTIFVWYLLFLYMVIVERKEQYFNYMLALSFLSIFVYEGCIFLVALNLLPFILNPRTQKVSHIIISVCLFAAAFLFLSTDFRRIGGGDFLPPDIPEVPASAGKILVPMVLGQTLHLNAVWLFISIIPFGLTGFIFYKLYRSPEIGKTAKISFTILISLALTNLYGLLAVLFPILFLIDWISISDLRSKIFKLFGSILVLTFLFWCAYGYLTHQWIQFFENAESSTVRHSVIMQLQLDNLNELNLSFSLKKMIFLFFNYPNFYKKIFLPWFSGIPVLTVLAFSFIGLLSVFLYLETKEEASEEIDGRKFLLAILLIMIIAVALLNSPYNTTRYTFFLFPLILILLITSMKTLALKLSSRPKISLLYLLAMIVMYLSVTEDFSLHHFLNINSREIDLRMVYDKERASHYYQRQDVKSPAEAVNQRLKKNDIVITTVEHSSYYLNKLDYIYLDFKSEASRIRSAQGGKKELWTNAKIIYREKDLFDLLNDAKSSVWLIVYAGRDNRDNVEKEISERFKKHLFYRSYDRKIDVYRIEHAYAKSN